MLNFDFQYRDRIPVAILGATGAVGQRLVAMLAEHPWFRIVSLTASEANIGKKYTEAVQWTQPSPLPAAVASMQLQRGEPSIEGVIAFSALDSSVAYEVESAFAENGYIVVSNTSAYRMDCTVPLLVPEINSSHLELLKIQKFKKGKIVAKPNCTAIALSLALKPLYDTFGISALHVMTMQSISGAGFPGVPSLSILGNVIPYIQGEEEKVETEPLKILGKYDSLQVIPASFAISAMTNRVPVIDGHTLCVSIKLKNKPLKEDLILAWETFTSELKMLHLPSAPEKPLVYFSQKDYPQPKFHIDLERGMAVAIGGLRPCPHLDYKFTICSNNVVRGAAGGAILSAELLLKKGHIYW